MRWRRGVIFKQHASELDRVEANDGCEYEKHFGVDESKKELD